MRGSGSACVSLRGGEVGGVAAIKRDEGGSAARSTDKEGGRRRERKHYKQTETCLSPRSQVRRSNL